jgi:hypothetical protein
VHASIWETGVPLTIWLNCAEAGTRWQGGKQVSTHIKSKPLEWWKGERMLYGRVHACKFYSLKPLLKLYVNLMTGWTKSTVFLWIGVSVQSWDLSVCVTTWNCLMCLLVAALPTLIGIKHLSSDMLSPVVRRQKVRRHDSQVWCYKVDSFVPEEYNEMIWLAALWHLVIISIQQIILSYFGEKNSA